MVALVVPWLTFSNYRRSIPFYLKHIFLSPLPVLAEIMRRNWLRPLKNSFWGKVGGQPLFALRRLRVCQVSQISFTLAALPEHYRRSKRLIDIQR